MGLEGVVLERWQRYWNGLFFVLLAVSAGVAVAGLGSGVWRGVTLGLAAGLALWYWHEVIGTGRALSGRTAALPSLAVAAALWTSLLVLHPIFQLLTVSAYQLVCSAPAPPRRVVPRIAAVGTLVVAAVSARYGFHPLTLVSYAVVTLALGLFVAMMQAISEQSEQRRQLLEQLESARGELAAGFGSQTGIDTQAAVTGEEASLAPEAQEALLRVAQEALVNVRKHAHAHRVQLTLSYLDDATLLDVCDDGVGFDPVAPAGSGPGGGFGLPGMRERLGAHGGTLTVEAAPGQGTTVAAALPRGPAGPGAGR